MREASPKISFVIPVYNTERFLSATLDSILAQTYPNFEVICSDDGSTDGSPRILAAYAAKDARVSVVTAEKNGGVSRARNLGLEHATGEYVWFFDSDDLLHPQAAEIMLRACEDNQADFAYTPVEQVPEEATLADCVRPVACTVECMASPTDPYRLHGNFYGVQHMLIRRMLGKDVRFELGVTYAEDVLFTQRLLVKGPKGVYIHAPLVYYRQRASSLVHSLGRLRILKNLDRVSECLKPLLMREMPSEVRTVLTRWLDDHDAGSLPRPENESACYAVKAPDGIRAKSTSGGVFTVLAEDVLARGGCVAGAVFAGDWSVRHALTETVEGLAAMRGSKYVRGVLDKPFLAELDAAVASGRLVLFTGLPCQVAAVRKRYGERSNLVLLDIICHGAPDAELWRRRVQELSSGGRKIAGVNFRDKRRGWGSASSTFTVRYADGSEYAEGLVDDSYGFAFLSNLILSDGCARCPFACERRVGDITLADFWDLASGSLDDRKGLSCVVVNTLAGRELFARVRDRFAQALPYPVSIVGQPNFHRPTRPHPFSREFQKDILAGMTFDAAVAKYKEHPKSVAVLNFHWEQMNFGALLTSFALSKHIADMGWKPQNIDYSPFDADHVSLRVNDGFESFRCRHLPRTRKIASGESLKLYTKRFKTFVVGSDQVWSAKLTAGKEDAFYLSFAGPGKRLIAAAASFGKVPAAARDAEELKARLGVFSAISVREKEDAQTVKDLVGQGACVPDPVFWVEPSVWHGLADEAKNRIEGEVVVYIVNRDETNAILGFLEMSGLTTPEKPARVLSSSLTPEEWLYAIRSARLVVTDSFHGTCFALLLHTPFVCIHADENRSARHRTMLEGLGLLDRFFSNAADAFAAYRGGRTVDWAKVDGLIAQYRRQGHEFIEAALATDNMESPEMAEAWARLAEYRKEHPCRWLESRVAKRLAESEKKIALWAQRCKLKEERDALRAKMVEQKARETKIWAERGKFKEERDTLRGKVAEQKAREATIWAERGKFKEERDTLRGKVAEQKAREATIWAERGRFQEERNALREQVAAQKERETKLWAERGKFQEERNALREQVAAQKTRESKLWAERGKFQEERNALREQVAAQKARETKLWAERGKFQEERNALREQVAAQKARETKLWAERGKFQEERNALREQVAAQKARETKLWAERGKFQEERNALRERVEAQKVRESKLWAERGKFQEERNALRREVARKDATLAALQASVSYKLGRALTKPFRAVGGWAKRRRKA